MSFPSDFFVAGTGASSPEVSRIISQGEQVRAASAPSSASPVAQQAGAVPYRIDPDGGVWVLLITNHRGDWIIPKGMIDANRTAEQTALNEALEEAGITGSLDAAPLGSFMYQKGGRQLPVQVFAMQVDRVLVRWLEQGEREREWFRCAEAIERVTQVDLRNVIRMLQARSQNRPAA